MYYYRLSYLEHVTRVRTILVYIRKLCLPNTKQFSVISFLFRSTLVFSMGCIEVLEWLAHCKLICKFWCNFLRNSTSTIYSELQYLQSYEINVFIIIIFAFRHFHFKICLFLKWKHVHNQFLLQFDKKNQILLFYGNFTRYKCKFNLLFSCDGFYSCTSAMTFTEKTARSESTLQEISKFARKQILFLLSFYRFLGFIVIFQIFNIVFSSPTHIPSYNFEFRSFQTCWVQIYLLKNPHFFLINEIVENRCKYRVFHFYRHEILLKNKTHNKSICKNNSERLY